MGHSADIVALVILLVQVIVAGITGALVVYLLNGIYL
jgi:hypothetical protein